MNSEFARLAGIARQAVDSVHGETVTHQPMLRSEGPHGGIAPDPERSIANITAAFFQDTDRAARMRAQPLIGQTGDRMLNRSPEIFASVAPAVDVAARDRILRQSNGQMYEVETLDPDGIGNVILGLIAIKVKI